MDNNEQIERERHGLCVICGAEMKWGKFAHNQDICFNCFKQQVNEIIFTFPVHSKERDILNWMMALVAERYGYEW